MHAACSKDIAYLVGQQHPGSSCARFWTFDTDIAKVRVAVVVQHATWQVEEIVKILVTIAYSPSWVRAESRLVWVAGDGIAVLKILQQNEYRTEVITKLECILLFISNYILIGLLLLTFHNGLIYAGQSPSDGKVISQMTSQKESQACNWRNSWLCSAELIDPCSLWGYPTPAKIKATPNGKILCIILLIS